jgi:hypothetical protein
MSDYDPKCLSEKWLPVMNSCLSETQSLWNTGKPKRSFIALFYPENDSWRDLRLPRRDTLTLHYEGQVVWGFVTRAFFPAYIPGSRTHYGSVVYSIDPHEPDSVFELAWQVNRLREYGVSPPPNTQTIAAAINDDRSNFSRLKLPVELGAHGDSYFANICIHRTRLPSGYLHDRFLPILVAPQRSEWCCILPLRFWSPALKEAWLTGPPAYVPAQFAAMISRYKVKP